MQTYGGPAISKNKSRVSTASYFISSRLPCVDELFLSVNVKRKTKSPLTFSKYLSRISRPQLAHRFFPVDGTELVVEVGEHTEGVDGVLGEERVSSRSMLDRWDSPSE